jgi:hypothetical protein
LEDFIFHEGSLPSGFVTDYEVSLFNLPEHRTLQSSGEWISFYVLHQKNKTTLAEIHFHISDGVALSPVKATFGSIEFSEEIPSKVIFQFIEFLEKQLRLKGVTKVTIKNPPQAYSLGQQNLLTVFLLNLGYTIALAEIDTVLSVSLPFDEVLDRWEKRKLKQAHEASLELKRVDANRLEEVYSFILSCRSQKGYSLSMTFDQIQQTLNHFPDRFLLMGIYKDDTLVAASISILVRSNVLYNFYSDHDKAFDQLSPVVLLTEGLYNYAATHKIALLDLGTSALEGKPNFGLLDFKSRLGGSPTPKFTFEKILN